MFDKYRDGQPIAVSIFEKAIKENKLSHAYLIDTNNYIESYSFILDFVKSIICFGLNEDEVENICRRIDDGNYTELKIIEADGNWIKKEQMVDLQDSFSLKGIEGSKRIYIIKDCDKMNVQTSNSILKFLEEPLDNIIAILMTNNVSSLLDTIISRCQYIRFNNNKKSSNNTISNLSDIVCYSNQERESFINDENNKSLIDNFINFVKKFEDKGTSIIVDIKKLWHNNFNEKYYVEMAIDLWINLYYDILLLINQKKIEFFIDYEDEFYDIVKMNSCNKIISKLEILLEAKNDLKYNLNLNLFIDKLVIDLAGE